MNDSRMKVGLLGAGYILASHASSLKSLPEVELLAVCDVSRARAEHAAASYGIAEIHSSLDDMLRSRVDVVHVLLPPHLHEDAIEKIIRAGKHAFVEKPMGLDAARCARLVALADEHKVRLVINHNFLFSTAYQSLREQIRSGACGALDVIQVNWLYPLGMLQLGPFNNWMFQSPANLLYELGPHAIAFALDLLGGAPDHVSCQAADAVELPGEQTVYRHWTLLLRRGRTVCNINLSLNPGQPDRSVHVRGSAGVARLDFERNVGWIEKARTNSALFDGLAHGRSVAAQISSQSRSNFRRYLGNMLKRRAGTNAFVESIHESIQAFYRSFSQAPDARLQGAFGADVIQVCAQAVAAAGLSAQPRAATPIAPAAVPTVIDTLVIGGTGFIGKRLVTQLVESGRGVRVLTRSRKAAALEFAGLPIDIAEGRHDDPAVLDRILPGMKTVYHLAKAVGEKWSDYEEADVKPTQVLAQACLKHRVGRFIYTGTIDSYDSAEPSTVINCQTPVDAAITRRNHYARSKATCEALLLEMHRQSGLPLVILRPGIVIGKGSPPAHWGVGMFLSDSLVKFWGDGTNPLPFVLVDDVASALVLAGHKSGIEGRTFLVTDQPLLSAREYVALVQEFSGMPIQQQQVPPWKYFMEDVAKELVKNLIRHPNRKIPSLHDWACRTHRARYDASETAQVLGWKPTADKQTLIQEGIRSAVAYYYR